MLGRYNVSNLLAVAAVLLDAGLTAREVAERFARLTAPAGRLERIGGDNEPLVVVDGTRIPRMPWKALCVLCVRLVTARGAALTVVLVAAVIAIAASGR